MTCVHQTSFVSGSVRANSVHCSGCQKFVTWNCISCVSCSGPRDKSDRWQSDLTVLIDNVLDAWAAVDPRRILTKAKLHVLVHLPEDIRRFGPAVIFATEIFECFNAIFRQCSILSNHLAPSHDIAVALGGMERFKHMVSGGYWRDEDSGQYVRAGARIPAFLTSNSELQRRLGWVDRNSIKPGV